MTRFYNLIDTRLLTEGIKRYAKGFWEAWETNVHTFQSLPSISQNVAFSKYHPEAYPLYSFSDEFSFLNVQIREQLFGGMTMVMSRLMLVKGTIKIF